MKSENLNKDTTPPRELVDSRNKDLQRKPAEPNSERTIPKAAPTPAKDESDPALSKMLHGMRIRTQNRRR